jgi:hypothetical protein
MSSTNASSNRGNESISRSIPPWKFWDREKKCTNDNDSAQRSNNAAALALSSFELLALSFCFRS